MSNTNLKFGVKNVDTSLAKDYLTLNAEFYPIGCEAIVGHTFDPCGNKIYCNDYPSNSNVYTRGDVKGLQIVKQEHFLKLSDEITKKAQLISQLDYMIRKNPIEETKLYMNLIEQQSIYWSQFKPTCKVGDNNYTSFYFTKQSSLLLLGSLPRILCSQGVVIKVTKEVAVITHLFTKMCHDAGLANVAVSFLDDERTATWDKCPQNTLLSGCVGVITERSDMESALDVFLDSTTSAPWKLNKIWVQECIYEEFKLSLLRKYNIKRNDADLNESISSDEFTIEDKRFLLDSTKKSPIITSGNLHVIIVEAYRTTKELISLINEEDNFLSLWASDISEANEIALAVTTPVVWINDFGCFYGPPKASQAIYSKLNLERSKNVLCYVARTRVNYLKQKLGEWHKLSNEVRKEMIRNIMIKLIANNEVKDNINEVYEMINEINGPDPYKFIDMEKGKICIGIDVVPPDVVYFVSLESNVNACLQVLLHGSNCVLNLNNLKPHYKKIFEALFDGGVPVLCEQVYNDESDPEMILIQMLCYSIGLPEIRVIRSNYGTIFAN